MRKMLHISQAAFVEKGTVSVSGWWPFIKDLYSLQHIGPNFPFLRHRTKSAVDRTCSCAFAFLAFSNLLTFTTCVNGGSHNVPSLPSKMKSCQINSARIKTEMLIYADKFKVKSGAEKTWWIKWYENKNNKMLHF